MPKLKVSDEDLDLNELEDAEYSEGDFESYDGEQPPKGTVLAGAVKKMWWTYTKNDDPMLVALWVADGNVGDEEEYDGLPLWSYMPLIASAKFRWAPFLNVFGLTIRDVKTKTFVEAEDEQFGAPIQKIANWTPGMDSDEAFCRVVTGREKYEGEWRTRIGKWLKWTPPEDADEPEEEPEEEEAAPVAKATRGRRTAKAEPEDEDEAKPARGRRSAAPAKAASKPAARGRRAKADEDEPPF